MVNHLSTIDQPEIKDKSRTGNVKARQDKVVRDGFSMPASEYAIMFEIQSRLLKVGVPATKSGILRAALQALNHLSNDDIVQLLTDLEPIKTGRPSTTK